MFKERVQKIKKKNIKKRTFKLVGRGEIEGGKERR